MTLPASITTNLFPDFKNSFIGPFPKIVQEVQDSTTGAHNFGANTGAEKFAQSFSNATGGELVSVDLWLSKTGSPTDNVTVELWSNNAGQLLATGTVIPAAAITGTSKRFRSVFYLPYTLVASTTYWLVVGRSGSINVSNNFSLADHTSNVYANGEIFVLDVGTWVAYAGSEDMRFKLNIRTSVRYQPCVDKANNKFRMFKSTDGGNAWTEQDSANAPTISTTATLKSISAAQQDTWICVMRVTDANGFAIRRFDTITDTWEALFTSSTSMPVTASVSGSAPMLMGYKPLEVNWDFTAACNGQAETVMGAPRRRIKFKRRGSGSIWPGSPGYDLVGSPNTPDLTTLPGTAVDYDLRAVLVDGNGVWHGFWTQSDDSNLRHRQYKEDQTFSTANLMGSTPLTTSNTAAYSVGGPANYYRNGVWNIAIPVESGGAIKVSRVLASDAATAASWTNTTVVASGAETTNSNPAVLVADNEQGGKLFLIYTKTDGKLYYTHDQANDSWVAEQELHPGTKTVGAISGGVMIDSIGICYLDTAPATDDLKFDSL